GASCVRRTPVGGRKNRGTWERNTQLLAPDQEPVVVHKVVPPLAHRPKIQPRILAQQRRRVHPDRPRKRLGLEGIHTLSPRPRRVDRRPSGEGPLRLCLWRLGGGVQPGGLGRRGRRGLSFREVTTGGGREGPVPLAE